MYHDLNDKLINCQQVCKRLPIVRLKFKRPQLNASQAALKKKNKQQIDCAQTGTTEEGYSLQVDLWCMRKLQLQQGIASAFAPRFPKVKDEGWWLIVGDIDTRDLYALKRLSIRDGKPTTVTLRFPYKNGAGQKLESTTLFLMSDSYVGLDQQYKLNLP